MLRPWSGFRFRSLCEVKCGAIMADIAIIPSYTLESGTVLCNVPLAYRCWGTLNDAADNAIVVGHSLTSSPDVDEWWAEVLGPGRALDTDHYFVVCVNVVGSPYGSFSPLARNSESGRPYGPTFPQTTIRDTVGLQKHLLESLGVRQVAFAVGGSMGGMQALEWAFYGEYVRGVVPIGVGGRHSAWCIAFSEAQRQAIFADASWKGGWYEAHCPPSDGLAVARMMAMVSYRSFSSFTKRFGRARMSRAIGMPYAAESYLQHHGAKLVDRFDANCYVYLTRLMDTHDVARGRGEYEAVLRGIPHPALAIGIRSDVLYPLAEQEELARLMPNARLSVMEHDHGHDTFLIEQEALSRIVQEWRQEIIDPHVLKGR